MIGTSGQQQWDDETSEEYRAAVRERLHQAVEAAASTQAPTLRQRLARGSRSGLAARLARGPVARR